MHLILIQFCKLFLLQSQCSVIRDITAVAQLFEVGRLLPAFRLESELFDSCQAELCHYRCSDGFLAPKTENCIPFWNLNAFHGSRGISLKQLLQNFQDLWIVSFSISY